MTTGEPLTTALITSFAVSSFLVCCFLADLELAGAAATTDAAAMSHSNMGWAFFSRVLGVCGVSYSRSFLNFLCGGVRPVRLPGPAASEHSPTWKETRLLDVDRVAIGLPPAILNT